MGGLGRRADRAQTGLDADGPRLDPPAGGVGEQLGAEADPEQRHPLVDGLDHQRARPREPRRAVVLPGRHGPAEDDDAVDAVQRLGKRIALVGPADVDFGAGLEVRAEPAEAAVVLVLDDEDGGHGTPHSIGR